VYTEELKEEVGEEPKEKAVMEPTDCPHLITSGRKGLDEVSLLRWQPS